MTTDSASVDKRIALALIDRYIKKQPIPVITRTHADTDAVYVLSPEERAPQRPRGGAATPQPERVGGRGHVKIAGDSHAGNGRAATARGAAKTPPSVLKRHPQPRPTPDPASTARVKTPADARAVAAMAPPTASYDGLTFASPERAGRYRQLKAEEAELTAALNRLP